jgi:hypothetical protein
MAYLYFQSFILHLYLGLPYLLCLENLWSLWIGCHGLASMLQKLQVLVGLPHLVVVAHHMLPPNDLLVLDCH